MRKKKRWKLTTADREAPRIVCASVSNSHRRKPTHYWQTAYTSATYHLLHTDSSVTLHATNDLHGNLSPLSTPAQLSKGWRRSVHGFSLYLLVYCTLSRVCVCVSFPSYSIRATMMWWWDRWNGFFKNLQFRIQDDCLQLQTIRHLAIWGGLSNAMMATNFIVNATMKYSNSFIRSFARETVFFFFLFIRKCSPLASWPIAIRK